MSANILRGCAATDCHRTFHFEHGGALPGGPFPGTSGKPGDVRRCEHGKVWRYRRTETGGSWIDVWERVSRFWEPFVYRRAIRALDAPEEPDEDDG